MAQAAHIRPEPLRMETPVEAFAAWLESARPGAAAIYARGAFLDPRSAVGERAREAQADGLVALHFRKDAGEGLYWAERLPPRDAGTGDDGPGVPMILDPETHTGRIYRILCHAAAYGHPCPSNRDIALALALRDEEAARYRLSKLVEAGHVRIDNRGPRLARIVTISATGQRSSDSRVTVHPPTDRQLRRRR